MPVMEGVELALRLSEEERLRTIPMLLVSTHGNRQRLREMALLGATG